MFNFRDQLIGLIAEPQTTSTSPRPSVDPIAAVLFAPPPFAPPAPPPSQDGLPPPVGDNGPPPPPPPRVTNHEEEVSVTITLPSAPPPPPPPRADAQVSGMFSVLKHFMIVFAFIFTHSKTKKKF